MKKYFKLSLLLLCTLFLTSPITSYAQEDTEIATYTVTADTETGTTVNIYPRLRGTHLLVGNGAISKGDPGRIIISASTTAHHTVPYIKVSMTLQRFVNGGWYELSTYSNTSYNIYYVSVGRDVNVGTGGYYYRIKTYHNAYGESCTAYSKAIFI